jgi:hypothetical protein
VTPTGEASIFAENEEFRSEGFGLNGIEYHAHEYLLVSLSEPGGLFKIPLDDPEAVTAVELSEPFSADGMVINPDDGHIIAVATTFNEDESTNSELIEVASDDEWETAEIVNRAPLDAASVPTTVTLRDGVPYVVYGHFNELFSGQLADAFEIERVDFPE